MFHHVLLVTSISLGIPHFLPPAECIVVEDNTISYFKLPTASVLSSLGCNTGKFSGTFILKCPRSTAAKSPESVQSCAIVRGRNLVQRPAKHFWDLFATTEKEGGAAEDQVKEGEVPKGHTPVEVIQKSFEELKERRRGHTVKGFHNIYHRDEFVQDHIFYDDLDHSGSFSNHGKSLHKE